jgi:hypothetical protein
MQLQLYRTIVFTIAQVIMVLMLARTFVALL